MLGHILAEAIITPAAAGPPPLAGRGAVIRFDKGSSTKGARLLALCHFADQPAHGLGVRVGIAVDDKALQGQVANLSSAGR